MPPADCTASKTRRQARRGRGLLLPGMWVLALVLSTAPLRPQELVGERVIKVPQVDIGALQLGVRAEEQAAQAAQTKVFHAFRFTDRLPESGITFRHVPTLDGTSRMRQVHYDHGNGVAVADVDLDGLLDLYFVTQVGANELWRNLGGGRFENITGRSPAIGLSDRISVAPAFADADNDGDPDLFVSTVRMGNVLFRNDGEGRFTDVTESSGLGHVGHSSGAVFFDYDLDGLLDLFVTNVGVYTTDEVGEGNYFIGFRDAFSGHKMPERTERSLLYRNLGDLRFEEVSEKVGLVDEGWAGDASPVDLNGDRYPDLYVLNMQGDDHYYENRGGERFVERTAELFPKTPWGAMGIAFFDYDVDGDLDLFLTDMHSDMSMEVVPGAEREKSFMTWDDEHLQGGANNIFGNAFYRNDGDDGFEEVSDRVDVENYWPWGMSIGDLNADGFEDAFVASSMSYPFRYGINSLLLNDRGEVFRRSEFVVGVEPRRDGRTMMAQYDIDCPTRDDVEPAALPDIQWLYDQCRRLEGRYTVWGTMGTRAAVIFDLEEDGDLDIVTGEFHNVPQVLVSDLSEVSDPAYVKIRLVGTKSNRDGLGALVRVTSGGRTQMRFHDGKSGYLAQSSQPLYFGLGDSRTIDSVEVVWPSGTVQKRTEDLTVGSTIEIVEP